MRTSVEIIKPCHIEADIEGITLLSAEEAEKLPQSILKCTIGGGLCWWWLRTSGVNQGRALDVGIRGTVEYKGTVVDSPDNCVRPVLKISNLKALNLTEYELIRIFDRDWIVISDNTVLCKNAIDYAVFHADRNAPDANDYEKSDIKEYLENWLEEQFAATEDADIKETITVKQAETEKSFNDFKIEEITLLSAEEAKQLPENIRRCSDKGIPCWWWLRSPDNNQSGSSFVGKSGLVCCISNYITSAYYGIRPALKISNLESFNLKKYETIKFLDRDWIVISDNMLLCHDAIGRTAFRENWRAPDAYDYEKSDIKEYLENWLTKQVAARGQSHFE